jgi:RecJ-like exonuclease
MDAGNDEPVAPGDEAPEDAESAGEDLCPECAGSGRIDGRTCPSCEGTGKVIRGIGGG